jgi:hypothetical protein
VAPTTAMDRGFSSSFKFKLFFIKLITSAGFQFAHKSY